MEFTQYLQKTDASMFAVGEVFPPQAHYERVLKCRQNKKLFKGYHTEVFHENIARLDRAKDLLYISVNFFPRPLDYHICPKKHDMVESHFQK